MIRSAGIDVHHCNYCGGWHEIKFACPQYSHARPTRSPEGAGNRTCAQHNIAERLETLKNQWIALHIDATSDDLTIRNTVARGQNA